MLSNHYISMLVSLLSIGDKINVQEHEDYILISVVKTEKVQDKTWKDIYTFEFRDNIIFLATHSTYNDKDTSLKITKDKVIHSIKIEPKEIESLYDKMFDKLFHFNKKEAQKFMARRVQICNFLRRKDYLDGSIQLKYPEFNYIMLREMFNMERL